MMKTLWALSPLLLFGFTACSQQSSSGQSSSERLTHLQTINSWTATAQMVAESWQQGTVPQPYARQTLEKTQQEIIKETDAFAKAAQPPPLLTQLKQTLQQLTIAVDQANQGAIAVSLQRLGVEKSQLQTLIQLQSQQP